jgi:arginase family enzyme
MGAYSLDGELIQPTAVGKPSGTILRRCSEAGAIFPTGPQAALFYLGTAARSAEAENRNRREGIWLIGRLMRLTAR